MRQGIERPLLFRQPPEPVGSIAKNEIVLCRIEAAQAEVAFTPVQIFFREIETCRARSAQRRAHRKTASVGEAVQDFQPQFGGTS